MSRRPGAPYPDGRTRLLGIVGDPLDHSLSPRLHSEVLRRMDRNLIYVPFPVSRRRLPSFVREAGSFGVLGFNVTTPYKEAVARYVRPADRETRRTGVVNTVSYGEGSAIGQGTDGAGILGFLRTAGLRDEPFGLLGFGATGRSLVWRSFAEEAPLAVLVTRRPEQAAQRCRKWGGGVEVVSWNALRRGTSAGFQARVGRLPGLWVSTLPPAAPPPDDFWTVARAGGILCDLNYGSGRTTVMERARAAGWRATDGLGPLCHQAALALEIWLGVEVPVRLFHQALGRTARSLRPER